MNRFLLIVLAAGTGVVGFAALHRPLSQNRALVTVQEQQWNADTNRLAEMRQRLADLREEVRGKKDHLREIMRSPEISPELLALLEGDTSNGQLAAWAKLRQELGIGWDSSPDYVLVSKHALKKLQYQRLKPKGEAKEASNITCDLLSLSVNEQSALRSIIEETKAGGFLGVVSRVEPSGDIVAQYSVALPDPAVEQSISNQFTTAITATIGSERANLLLPDAWRDVWHDMAPYEAETMIIRRSNNEGEPDLICEIRGGHVSTMPVRYAHYPSSWFLKVFPGGWKTLAQREGFELPGSFPK